jgi:hypothetical protein
MSVMTTNTPTVSRRGRYLGAPKLRLLASSEKPPLEHVTIAAFRARPAPRAAGATAVAPELEHARPTDAPVLIAGRDTTRRASMIDELKRAMPHGTKFVHASAFWEVLVHAGSSRMVILSGDLDEVPTESLMRMLSHRYPSLPVVALDAPSSALARA